MHYKLVYDIILNYNKGQTDAERTVSPAQIQTNIFFINCSHLDKAYLKTFAFARCIFTVHNVLKS